MYLNMLKKTMLAAVAVLIFSSTSFAEQQSLNESNIEPAVVENITAKMSALQIQVVSIAPFAVDGLYELLTDKGIFYISKNTQFLIEGNVYDLENNVENVSEKSLAKLRKKRLQEFEKNMIVYKAAEEKHVITVFTDTSCVYCQKLHEEMENYNKQGITVRYLAFPRSGVASPTYQSMVSIWCADDPKEAMNIAKKHRRVETKTCANNVDKQYELGLQFGVTGTPAIILEDGSLKPGYLPADRLIQIL